MVYEVNDKVFFVTGGASGIGAETIKNLLEEGAKHVAILDLSEERGVKFQEELNSKYGNNKARFYKCDVTIDDQLFAAYKSVIDDQGYIDVVINSAGIMNDSVATYKKEIEINVTALITSTYKAIELMRIDQGGKGGTVINISSIAALHLSDVLPIYFATKSAVLQFNRCIASESYYVKTGVRILTQCFGVTTTALYTNVNSFDTTLQQDIPESTKGYPKQSAQTAGKHLVEAFKIGKSGSIYISTSEKPLRDITDIVDKSFALFHDIVWN